MEPEDTHYGVFVGENGSATIEKNHITEIRNVNQAGFGGCQDGHGVRIGSEFLGETPAAERVREALAKTDSVTGTTSEIGDAIVAALQR